MNTSDIEKIEEEQFRKFREVYTADMLKHDDKPADDFFAKAVKIRENLIKKYYKTGKVLDLCCGSGDYLIPIASEVENIVGLDFSPELIEATNKKIKETDLKNIEAIIGNGKEMPFKNDNFSLLFSFSSLYCIPQIDKVIKECARVLETKGIAILEFGISHSLNTIVCKAYPEYAYPCHISRKKMYEIIKESGFRIIEDRATQIFPYWGDRPKRFRRFINPRINDFMAKEIGGKMLDEWVSNLPIIGHFAFRRTLICEKI